MSLETNQVISELIEKAAKNLGYTIYRQNVLHRKGQIVIDVRIDNNAIVSIDDCSSYSRELTNLLDNYDDEIDYVLEVSSPGLKRELRTIEEFKRFLGSNAKIKYINDDKTEVIHGKIENVDADSIDLKTENKMIKIIFANIKTANLDY